MSTEAVEAAAPRRGHHGAAADVPAGILESPRSRYLVALLLTPAALLLALPVHATVGRPSVMIFIASVAIAAVLGGLRPGLVATVLSMVLIDFFLLDERYSLVVGRVDLLLLGVFNFVAVVVCFAVELVHLARRSAEQRAIHLQRVTALAPSDDDAQPVQGTQCERTRPGWRDN